MPLDGGGMGQSAGMGQSVQQLLEEMKKAQSELQKLDKTQKPESTKSFHEVMESQKTGGVGQVSGTQNAQQVLSQTKLEATNSLKRVQQAANTERSHLANMLEKMIQGQDKMTGIMNMAMSGKNFSPSELLAMQAQVYRYSQELELTSKVVEKGTGGLKQLSQTQV